MSNEVGFQIASIAQQRAEGSRADKRGLCEVPALFIKSIDEAKRQIRVLASSAALDRHGERILPEAFAGSIATFMKNPICLAAHARSTQWDATKAVEEYQAWLAEMGDKKEA